MFGLFQNRERDALVGRIHGEILTQARHPALYTVHAVPDTVEGRYDMMVLHVVIVTNRLGREGADMQLLAQEICDRFFTEMDRALREMGVGDLGVPKKMKSIAQLYAGCARSYSDAFSKADDADLAAALARNVYEDKEPVSENEVPAGAGTRAAALAAYVRAAVAALAAVPAAGLVGQPIPFPDPARSAA